MSNDEKELLQLLTAPHLKVPPNMLTVTINSAAHNANDDEQILGSQSLSVKLKD